MRQFLRASNYEEQVLQFCLRMLAQIFTACIYTDHEPVGMHLSKRTCAAAVTCSEVQDDLFVICDSFLPSVKIYFKGLFAPNCFHEKPPFCRVDMLRQNGAGADRERET